jgi:hypothetical protein
MSGVRLKEWKPMERNALRGFATVEFASGLVINDVSVLVTDGKPWASPPSKPMLNRDGQALKDKNGKIRYQPIIEFANKAARDRWSDAVVGVVQRAHPEALSS